MPIIANMTVKKFDNVTDILFTAVNPSGGPDSPAIFRSETVGTAISHRPALHVSVKNSGPKDRVVGTFKYPQISTNTTTGVTSIVETADGRFEFMCSKAMNQNDVNEAASQFAHLLANALLKGTLSTRTNLI